MQAILLSYSPYLSDLVLASYFSDGAVPASNVIAIHNANKPVSAAIWQIIVDRGFNTTDMSTLEGQQSASALSVRQALDGEVVLNQNKVEAAYAEKLNYFLNDTLIESQDSVIVLLSEHSDFFPDAAVQKINAYQNAGYYTRAFAVADSLSAFEEYEDLMVLQQALLELDTSVFKADKILYDQDLNDIIATYAADSTLPGSEKARAVLRKVYGIDMFFEHLIPSESEERYMSQSKAEEQNISSISGISQSRLVGLFIYPNPANNSFAIYYSEGVKKEVSYKIFTAIGQEIQSGSLNEASLAEISTSTMEQGLYLVSTYSKYGRFLAQKKLFVIR